MRLKIEEFLGTSSSSFTKITPFFFFIVFFIACSNEANIERDKDFIENNVHFERTSQVLKNGN